MNTHLTLSERKRAAIVDAALREFREKGFQATSMDALSARAGVSKRTVYNHFPSKEALFHELVQQMFNFVSDHSILSYSAEQTLADQLTRFARSELALFQSTRFQDLAKVLLVECVHSPDLADETRTRFEQQEKGLDNWLVDAIADGRLKPVDASYAANQFIGVLKASLFWPQLLMNLPLPTEEQCTYIINDSVQMFLTHHAIDPIT